MTDWEIGKYYIRLKSTHIEWKRKAGPRGTKGEAYLPIPATFAYSYGIKKGDSYQCKVEDESLRFELKAEGTQSRREYAKQFAGKGNLHALYEWYEKVGAVEGDFVIVTIYSNNKMSIKYVSQTQKELVSKYGLVESMGRPLTSKYPLIEDHGLKLASLVVKDGENTICDVSFLRENVQFSYEYPTTSLIIGPNGAGKSSVLKYITEIINACLSNSSKKTMQYSYYCLKYFLGKQTIEIEISNNAATMYCDGNIVEEHKKLYLPQKVLAIAFMLNDKFVFKSQGADDVYEYLGIKSASNSAWTNFLSNRIAENIIDITINNKLITLIEALSEYLQLDNKFAITFDFEDEKTNYADSSLPVIKKKVMDAVSKTKAGKDFRSDVAKKIKEDDIELYAEFIQQKARKPILTLSKKKRVGLWLEERVIDDDQTIKNDYQIIRNLTSIGIIKNVTLWLYKDGKGYSFDESSSGEKHILYVATCIARHVCDNSLVLIDEPEISLHPNWQMKYIGFLKRVFSKYFSCHFIIASHSPYLVSDLAPDSSSLISFRMDGEKRIAETIDYDTYAWSAENVLYNIFGVRTTRNFYFNSDLQELLSLVNEKGNLKRIKELYTKLNGYVFSENDPLHLIMNNVKEYIDHVES